VSLARSRLARGALAVLVFGAAVLFLWRGSDAGREPAAFTTVPLTRGDIVARVTATGTLSALVTVQVGSQVSGRISDILVDFNSPVKQGQVIARLDPQLFRATVEQARANRATAEANAARARVQAAEADRQARRADDLYAQKAVSVSDRDTARANAEAAHAAVDAAKAAIAQARAALLQAEINLAYTTIVAPTDGVVISRNVDVGQTVAATLAAPTLFTIAQDLRQMQVHTSVAEADVGRLAEGMAATFTVDAYPGQRFEGRVRQIRNAPQTLQNVVTYDAVIDVDNAELRLKPGMTANVSFTHAERRDVLRAPNAALRFHPPEGMEGAEQPLTSGAPPGQRTLWVLRDGVPQPVAVRTGVSDGTATEIVEGEVQVGEPLIVDAGEGDKKRAQPPVGRIF
jgi:HlyD family secretion protein